MIFIPRNHAFGISYQSFKASSRNACWTHPDAASYIQVDYRKFPTELPSLEQVLFGYVFRGIHRKPETTMRGLPRKW